MLLALALVGMGAQVAVACCPSRPILAHKLSRTFKWGPLKALVPRKALNLRVGRGLYAWGAQWLPTLIDVEISKDPDLDTLDLTP